MKLLTIVIIFFLSGCLDSATVDISALSIEHRALFREAARIEGVDTTVLGLPSDWTVDYDFSISGAGRNERFSPSPNVHCSILINPNNLTNCDSGGINQHFIIVSRHELRHCENGPKHSSNPQNLMYKSSPCWPID